MKALFISLLILANGLNHSFGQVEKISYRNWENCYRLKNKKCEVIIGVSCGGRVLSFSIAGKSIIYENETQNGRLLNDWQKEWFDPDAGRFDYGPEKITQPIHSHSWMGKWNPEITGNYSLKLTSMADSALGLQSDREFVLNSDSAILTIHQTARNISDKNLVRHFWGRTLLKPNGVLWMPLHPESRFENGWGRFLWNPDRIKPNPATDGRIQISKNNFRFYATGKTIKGGTNSPKGWMAYVLDNLVFVKQFRVYPDEDYSGSDHMTTIFYSNGKFVELDPCSPFRAE
ncbi:MAG: hypothetical protein GZ094_15685 [Mariniphaga sp.]|nr:hypothetical protein [Mariniphaga sp.]